MKKLISLLLTVLIIAGTVACMELSAAALDEDTQGATEQELYYAPKIDDDQLLFYIEEVFVMTGKGLYATGNVESGTISVGDDIVITSLDADGNVVDINAKVEEMEQYRKKIETASKGENVGIHLGNLFGKDENDKFLTGTLNRGDVIQHPDKKIPTVKDNIAGVLVMNSAQECGLTKSIDKDIPYYSCFGTSNSFNLTITDLNGSPIQPDEVRKDVVIKVDKPVVIYQGLKIYMREMGKNIGVFYPTDMPVCEHKTRIGAARVASFKEDGYATIECGVCKKVFSSVTYYKISTVKLSADAYAYDGKAHAPNVIVKDRKGKTISSKNYKVTMKKNTCKIGNYTVTVKFKGNYTGSKKLTYSIGPKGTKITKTVPGSKKLTLKWNKQTNNTNGYQVQYGTSNSFSNSKTKLISSNKTTTATLTKLTSKKTCYARIRTYKSVGGVKVYSPWSKTVSAKIK